MKLIPEWRQVLTGAWSSLLGMLVSIFLAAGAVWEYFTPDELGLSIETYLGIAAFFAAFIPLVRVTKQNELAVKIAKHLAETSGAMKKKAVGAIAGSAVAMAAAVAFVGGWEGMENQAYWDRFGKVWTVCYGETLGVKKGDYYTDEECAAMLHKRLVQFEAELDQCLKTDVPHGMKIALVSWAYNVGSGAACRSTLVRKANAGDLLGACHELPRWNRSGGSVIRGLTNRRGAERHMCLSSL